MKDEPVFHSRLPDWDRRLARVTDRHMRLSPEWGMSDCLITVADAYEAVTGQDLMTKWRGRYKTEKGAARLMKRNGCANVDEVFRDFFKLEPVGRLLAQRGDVGVIEQGGELTAGYVTDLGFAAKGPTGLVFHPQAEMISAFKVGR